MKSLNQSITIEIVTDDSNIDVVTSAIDVLKQLVVHKKKVDGLVPYQISYVIFPSQMGENSNTIL